MSPEARLWAGAIVAATGGALLLIASQLPWARIVAPGAPVRLPGRTVFLGGGTENVRGSEVTSSVIVFGVLVLGGAVAALLVGPRARALVLALVAIASVAACVAALREGPVRYVADVLRPQRLAGRTLDDAAGDVLAVVGGGVAFLGAVLAMSVALRVPRLRLPEQAPEP